MNEYTDNGVEMEFSRRNALLFKDMGTRPNNLMHAAIGISGEAGELLDAIKKHWVYGKPLDRANVIEELGDLEFYMEALRTQLNLSRTVILEVNMDKLAERYGRAYSDAAAIARADKTGEQS